MNEDFEEEYDDEEDDGQEDFERAKDKAKEAKDKYNEQKKKKADNGQKSNNDLSQYNEARDFDKSLRDKNMARSNANAGGKEAGKEVSKQAAKETGKQAAKTGATTAGGTAAGGTAAGGTAAGGAAAGGAAAGGAAAGLAAIPVAGWILLAVGAVIALYKAHKKRQKRRDEKNAENGVDTKTLRKLRNASPLLLPIAIVILIIVILLALMQGETYDRVEFMAKAIECFESEDGCNDFMNTGWRIGNGWISTSAEPLIRKTDIEIAEFVVSYKIAEHNFFGDSENSLLDFVGEVEQISREGLVDDKTVWEKIVGFFEDLVKDGIIGDVYEAWHLFKWLKMEKKVFNNIQWVKAYKISSVGGFTDIYTWVDYKFTDEPEILFEPTSYERDTWNFGFHIFSGTCSWLELPLDLNFTTENYKGEAEKRS